MLCFCVDHIREVANWYKKSFQELRACAIPHNIANRKQFDKSLFDIFERHAPTLITMAKGAVDLRKILGNDVSSFAAQHEIQKILDDFYMSRIGIRMVTNN